MFLCVLIYVDDLLITGNSLAAITKFREYLSSYFHMKDLGPLKYFLGIEVAQNPFRNLFMSTEVHLQYYL